MKILLLASLATLMPVSLFADVVEFSRVADKNVEHNRFDNTTTTTLSLGLPQDNPNSGKPATAHFDFAARVHFTITATIVDYHDSDLRTVTISVTTNHLSTIPSEAIQHGKLWVIVDGVRKQVGSSMGASGKKEVLAFSAPTASKSIEVRVGTREFKISGAALKAILKKKSETKESGAPGAKSQENR